MTERAYPNSKIDRTDWPAGPWDDEPDTAEWVDAETGLRCFAGRNLFGVWAGYVAVPPGHPWYGDEDATKVWRRTGAEEEIDFAGKLRADPHAWWFGFHCGHGIDIQPGILAMDPTMGERMLSHWEKLPEYMRPRYKPLAYARGVCATLARGLATAKTNGQ